jgi:PAS domain S-box-containing protein
MGAIQIPAATPAGDAVAHGHTVQFYSEDRFLLEELGHFIGAALAAGSSAVIIATPAHEDSLSHRLMAQGVDLAQAIVAGRYVVLDAAETLSRFMVHGQPDPGRFSEIMAGIIARAASAAQDENHRVVAFGEMVALLWAEGKSEAAIQLEKLWNQAAKAYSFALRCAYPMQGFCREDHAESLLQICAEHSQVLPGEERAILSPQEENSRDRVRLQQRTQTLLAEIEVQRRQQQFWLFVEAVPDYAIFMLDPAGNVNTWNAGVERLHGYKAAEIVGMHFSRFYTAEQAAHREPQKLLDLAIQNGHAQDEGWRVRKDGSTFWGSVTVAAVRDVAGKLIGFGTVTHDLSERRRVEMALHRSEDRFRLMAEVVQDYAIFMLDPDGNVATWNTGAKRIKGYSASEIIGRHFSCFYPEKDIRADKPARELAIAVRDGRLEDEGWRLRKDGSRFWANVVITPVRDESNKLIGFTKVTRDMTERMRREQSLKDLTSRLLRMQDEERRRIGRDLHDTLGQSVTAMKISLDSLAQEAGSENPRLAAQLASCVRIADECVKEVRTLSYLLYPPMLDEVGLKSAIAWYLEGFKDRSGIQATFDAPAGFPRLSRDVELALFRVLQESLTNVHRHSGSAIAHVKLAVEEGVASLEVRDEGKGFASALLDPSPAQWQHTIGVGLRGMRERLGQLGGKLDIASSSKGTAVIATVPIAEFSNDPATS